MEYSLAADEDEDREITEEFDLSADEDDDILTMDATRDETEDHFDISGGGEIAENRKDEGLFDLKENIGLDYGFDDDEEDIIDLDDTDREEENQNFANLLLADSKKPDPEDDSRDATEFLELESEKPDNLVIADADREENPKIIALAEEDVNKDDLPDIEAISGLDFEEEEDTDQLPEDDEEFMALSEEKPMKLNGNDGLLDLDDNTDPADDFEVPPLEGLNGIEAEDEKEIIEITEFDHHFPADDESLLKQSGRLDRTAEDEDKFLELIDVDEDSAPKDEEFIEFSDSPLNMDNAGLDQFFSEDLEDGEPLTQASETIFSDEKEDKVLEDDVPKPIIDDSLESEPGFDDEIQETAAELNEVESERTPKAGTVFPDDEEVEFNWDPGTIAKPFGRLDTFLSEDSTDEPVVASLYADRAVEKETGSEESQAGPEIDEPLALPPGQIDAAIERVINEKFSDKIENIIYEVIEKAVAKEINRLKRSLLGNNSIDDDQI
jgi:hypothetical protein